MPSRSNSAMPRPRAQSQHQQRGADRAQRRLPQRRDLGQRHLRRDLVQAPEEAAERRAGRRRARRGGRPCDRRSSRATVARPPTGSRSLRVMRPSAQRAAHSQRRRRAPLAWAKRRDGDVPAGRMAQRRAPRRFAQHLDASPASSSAPIARRGAALMPDQPHAATRHAGMQHAGQAAVVQQVGPRQAGRAASAARRRARPRRSGGGTRAAKPSAPTSERAGEVGGQVQRAAVHERRAPARATAAPARAPAASRAPAGRAAHASAAAPARQQRGRARAPRRGRAPVSRTRPARARARRSRCAASVAGSTCVGCSSRRARCCARRSSR